VIPFCRIKMTAVHPKNRFSSVKKFGIFFMPEN